MSSLNDFGQEVFDQHPVFTPLKFERPIPLHLRVRDQILLVQEEMRHQNEFETPEDADDFEIDGEEWNSPYEMDFDHIGNLEKSSDVSKESPSYGLSDGTAQAERSEASSSDNLSAPMSDQ